MKNSIRVRFGLPDGTETFEDIYLEMKVGDLIEQISRKYWYLVSPILLLRGKVLESAFTLADYSMNPDDKIEIRIAVQPKEMEIFIYDEKNIYPLIVSGDWTVDQFKSTLERLGINKVKGLKYENRSLGGTQILRECGFYNGCFVKMD